MRFDVFLRDFLSIGFLFTVSGVVSQALRGVPLDASFILSIAGLSMLVALPFAGLAAWTHDTAVEAAVWIADLLDRDSPAPPARERARAHHRSVAAGAGARALPGGRGAGARS
jgi:hypothetical protein